MTRPEITWTSGTRESRFSRGQLACQIKPMTHMLRRDLHVMVCAGLMRQYAEMTQIWGKLEHKSYATLLSSPLHCFTLSWFRRARHPVHLSSFWASFSSSSIHHDSERNKTHGLITGHKDTPIFRRLADQGSISGGVISQHKSGGRPNRISRLDNKSGQIGVDTNSSVLFCGIRIPSELSPCKAHSGEVAKTAGINPQDNQPVCLDCKTFDVAHWVASIKRKNGPGRPPSRETLSVASQGELDISSVAEQAPSL